MVVLSRRRLLAGLALVGAGAVACEPGGDPAAPAPTTSPPPPDPLLAELVDERALLVLYDAVARRHPALRTRLAGPRADHAEHVTALEQLLGTTPAPTASVPAVGVPAAPKAALAALRSAERAAANARSAAALDATGERSGVLASIAASEATHGLVLA